MPKERDGAHKRLINGSMRRQQRESNNEYLFWGLWHPGARCRANIGVWEVFVGRMGREREDYFSSIGEDLGEESARDLSVYREDVRRIGRFGVE